jgi:hypothetical protein
LNCLVPEEVALVAVEYARAERLSVNALARLALQEYLNAQGVQVPQTTERQRATGSQCTVAPTP